MKTLDYLDRIGLTEAPPPSLEGLTLLQDYHMRHVPFENLDVILGRPLDLSVEALFEKIVTRRRGGYCFELNTLYARLLREIGFDPVPMMARVWLRDPPATPPRTHLVHRVKIDGQDWITDVGFGGRAARMPMKIQTGYEVEDGDGLIRVISDAEFGYRVQRLQTGQWADQYTAELAPAPLADILIGNFWTETHPESHFRQGIGVGLFTEAGRVSYYGGVFTDRGGQTETQNISGLNAVTQLLAETFGIELNMTAAERMRLSGFTGP